MERPPRAGPALRHCIEPNTAGSIAGTAENAAMASNVAVKRRYFMDGNYIAACAQYVPRAHARFFNPLAELPAWKESTWSNKAACVRIGKCIVHILAEIVASRNRRQLNPILNPIFPLPAARSFRLQRIGYRRLARR